MLKRVLEHAGTVAIGGHIRPDGDCVGSCMGLYQYIRLYYPQIKTDVYLEEIPDRFRFIKATEEIKYRISEGQIYDLFICLDCGDAERLGFSKPLFESAEKTFCIDHHVSNEAFADENHIVPEASSTAELVYGLLDDEKITTEIAECLYLGIAHDTGVFQYSCTAPETMEVAANLMRKGINASEIIDETFYEKTYAQNQALGRALLDSTLCMEGKCIVSAFSKEMQDFYGVEPKDLEGIVGQMRVTKGVEVAVFLYELEKNEYKISLRASGNVDVSKIAGHFGGGGHKKAAGLTTKGNVKDIINQVTEQIQAQL